MRVSLVGVWGVFVLLEGEGRCLMRLEVPVLLVLPPRLGWSCGPEGAPPAPETRHPEDEMLTCHVDLCNLDRLWAEQEEWSGSLKGARGRGQRKAAQTVATPAPSSSPAGKAGCV